MRHERRRVPKRSTWLVTSFIAFVSFTSSGCDAPIGPVRSSPFDRLDITASVDVNGTAQLRNVYRLHDNERAEIRIDAPAGGELTRIEVDGNPVRPTGSMTVVDIQGPRAVVAMTMTNTVEVFGEAATVRFPLWHQSGIGVLGDPLIESTLTITLPAGVEATQTVGQTLLGATDANVTTTKHGLDATGWFHPERNATIIVNTTAAGFSGVAESRDTQPGSRRSERVDASIQRRNDAYFTAAASTRRRHELFAYSYWGLIGFLVFIPIGVALVGAFVGATRRRRASTGIPERLSEPPDNSSGALVALIDQFGTRLGPRAVAATVLELIDKGAIELESTSSTRFWLHPVAPAPTTLDPAQAAVLDEVTRLATFDPDLRVHAPIPLVLDGPWWRTFCRESARQARRLGLTAYRFPRGIVITCIILLMMLTTPLWSRTPGLAAGALVAALVLAALSTFGGVRLTAAGLRTRASWRAFARHGEDSIALTSASAPAIAIWGPHLTAAAALGVNDRIVGELCRRNDDTPRSHSSARPPTHIPVSGLVAAIATTAMLLGVFTAPSAQAASGSTMRHVPATAATASPVSPAPLCAVGSKSSARTLVSRQMRDQVPRDLACQDLSGLALGQMSLAGVDLRRADLRETDLTQAHLEGALLGEADLRGARLGQTSLKDADLSGADLRGADFTQAEMQGASLRGAKADNATFGQAEMGLADLRSISAPGAAFGQANLVRVDASDAVFDHADFTQAEISESDFTNASFLGAELDVSQASGAVMHGADLHDAKWVDRLRSSGADLGGTSGLDTPDALPWLGAAAIVMVAALLLGWFVIRSRSLMSRR